MSKTLHRLLMSMSDVTLETSVSADGLRRWTLVCRSDGLFVHSEEFYVDLHDCGGGIDGYWSSRYRSGLFDTLQAAKDDAMGSLPWLLGQAGTVK